MTLRYRPATVEDAPLLGLWNARLYEDERNPGWKSLEEFVSRMRGWLAGNEHHGIVFETDEGPVGYALYRQETNPGGHAFWRAVGFRPYSHRLVLSAEERTKEE